MQKARDAVNEMRASGTAYNHLSKDGTPEPVYFTRLPEIKNGNPNTPVSLQKLKDLAIICARMLMRLIFRCWRLVLGNKVLFDIGAGPSWNSMGEKRRNGYAAHLFFRQQFGRRPVRRNYERAALLVGTCMAQEKTL